MWKWLRRILLIVISVPILGIFTWYGISFLPHLSELKSIKKDGEIMVSSASDRLYPLMIASESKEHMRGFAIKEAYRSLVYEKKGGNNLSWHLNNLLWITASYIHFTDMAVFDI